MTTKDHRVSHGSSETPLATTDAVQDFRIDQGQHADTQVHLVDADQTTESTRILSRSNHSTSARSNSRVSHKASDTHTRSADAAQSTESTMEPAKPIGEASARSNFRVSYESSETHTPTTDADPTTESTRYVPVPMNAALTRSSVPSATKHDVASLADHFLYLQAQVLDDLERTRIANENRLRQLTRVGEDADGNERGFGLTLDHPDVAQLADIVAALQVLEHQAELSLGRALRRHPLWPWINGTIGVGVKQGARLLAAIGDPYWNTLHNRPRTVSELWAYCGLHTLPADPIFRDTHSRPVGGAQDSLGRSVADTQIFSTEGTARSNPDHSTSDTQVVTVRVAAKRKKGQRANWSTTAKMRAYLVAEKCVQTGKAKNTPYYQLYRARRAHTAITHPEWTLIHSHKDGLRIVSKKGVLQDLWLEAKAVHETNNHSIPR